TASVATTCRSAHRRTSNCLPSWPTTVRSTGPTPSATRCVGCANSAARRSVRRHADAAAGGRPPQPAVEVLQVGRVVIGRWRMAQRGDEYAAAVVVVVPGQGMVAAHAARDLSGPDAGRVVAGLVHRQHGAQAFDQRRVELVPLVAPEPARR